MDPRIRRWAQRVLYRLEAARRRATEIRAGDPMAARFAGFGARSTIGSPQVTLQGLHAVAIGDDTTIRSYVAIEALAPHGSVVLDIGSRCHFGHGVRFVALNGVLIADEVAIGHGCTVTDTIHDYKRTEGPQWAAPLKVGRPLRIESGAWIGNNCVVTGGITIGSDSIVGANSVINRDVPPSTIVAGNPARVLRRKRPDGEWEWVVDPASLDLDLPPVDERPG